MKPPGRDAIPPSAYELVERARSIAIPEPPRTLLAAASTPAPPAKLEQAQRIWKAFALAPLAVGSALAKLQRRVLQVPRPKRPLPSGSR